MSIVCKYTPSLWKLAHALLSTAESDAIRDIAVKWPSSYDALIQFDHSIGGPGFSNISCNNSGRYHVDDRDIFRPLQYFDRFFYEAAQKESRGAWHTREMVHLGGVQLESLIKRIAGVDRLPLGQLLLKPLTRMHIDKMNRHWLQEFTRIYNAAKHDMDQPKDTHLFTVEDVILCYFIVRKLASTLYPLAKLYTDLTIFDSECSE